MHKNNNLDNTYVIGDVHGCFHTLQNLIKRLPNDAELIFVGDLCDKGNFSKEVISFVIDNDHACVKGNHEYLMQIYLEDAIFNDKHSPWSSDKRYGGLATFLSYQDDHAKLIEHLEWVKSLPIYLELDKYFITHGFALPYYAHRGNPDYNREYLLNRYEVGMQVDNQEVINIFGHCVFDEVVSGENFYGIDTGCSYGKKLTALQLGTMQYHQEPMDVRDSDYSIKELKLTHIELPHDEHTITDLRMHIDILFTEFDLISTEVAEYIVQRFGETGKQEIALMLEKKQIFMRQAKKVLES